MKMTYVLKNPDQLEATLSITMKIHEFKGLKKQINSDYPGWKLQVAIEKIIRASESVFCEEEVSAVEV